MVLEQYLDEIVRWLKRQLKSTKTNGFVVGVSGGIDSAVVLALAKKAADGNVLGLVMPCLSQKEDVDDAILVCEHLNVNYTIINLDNTYNELITILSLDASELVLANIKPRLRMTSLYAYAANNNYLVLGTDNLAEWYTGYFTKYGDGGVDLQPIIHLTKGEVVKLAELLNIPAKIINKRPTAGIMNNSYDEDELKVSYKELDMYLLGREIKKESENRIKYLHKVSQHKRKMPKTPKKPKDLHFK